VVAVAATDSSDRIASFSSDGPRVEIAAPGVNVYSATRGGGYAYMNGTSMAAPHVSGVVADTLSAPIPVAADLNQDGVWSRGEIRSYLQLTADELGNPGRDVFFGYGLVDTEEVVTGSQTQ
jgi:subtilisin family serine protease